MKKRKLLVLTPLLALTLSGCFARVPLPATSGQSTSGSGSTTSTSSEPEETTYGTMDAPITVARAVEIAKEQYSDLKAKSFVDKDAYVKGVLKNNPIKSKDTDEYRFTVGDSFEATTTLDFYYGSVGEGVTMPVQGDSVIMLGRLLDVDGGTTIRLAGSESEQVADPVVKKTDHMTYTLTLEKTGEATVTGLPTSAKSGDKVEFTVAPGTGYDIDEVLIDGIYDYAADNKYSFTVGHNTKVTVTAVQGLVKSDLRKAFEAGLELEGSAVTEAMTFKGTVVATSGTSFFLQDGKYGMYVYNKATAGIAVGKEVTVTSTIQNYNGTIETKTVSASNVTGYGTMPTAGEVTSLKSLAALRQSVLANAKNVKFVTKDKEWSDSQTSIAKFDVNGETLTVKFEKYGYTATEAAVLNAAKEGDVLSIYSAVTTTNYGDPQLLFGSTSSFTKEVTPVVKPTTVTVTPATKEIHLDQKDVTLTATVGPEGADVKTVTWSSSHPLICDVNATTGLLDPKAISDTIVTITATSTANPDAKGTCAVTVTRVPVTSVVITETGPINLAVGGATATLHTTVLPDNATDKSLTWSVEPATGVVSVANGVITPEGAGDATVTAASVSDPAKTATIAVHVSATETHVTDVVFNPTAKTIKIGDTFDLNTIVTVLPEEATNKNLTWESSSAAVTVNDGVIEGKAVTTSPVTITATSQDVTTVKGEIAITVEKIPVTKVELDKTELTLALNSEDETLVATVSPDNATNKEVEWSVAPEGIVTVSDAGVVHPVAAGNATITVTSKDDSSKNATCTVTVKTSLKYAYDIASNLQISKSGDKHPTTEKYTFSGTIVAKAGANYYVQDGGYGMQIYYNKTDVQLAVGKKVTVEGTLLNYQGIPETDSIETITVDGDATLPTPVEITSLSSITSVGVSVLANVQLAKFVSKTYDWSATSNGRGVFKIGSDDVTITLDKSLYNQTKGDQFNNAAVNDEFKLTNVVTSIYKKVETDESVTTSYQLTAAGSSTFEKIGAVMHTVTFSAGGGTGTMTAGEVEDGKDFQLPSCSFTAPSGKVFDAWSYNSTKYAVGEKIQNVTSDITVTALWKDIPTGDVTDELTRATTSITGTSYGDWSGKQVSSAAVYAGNSAGGNDSIQLRSSNNSGIISTVSGGRLKKVTLAWNSNTTSGRTVQIYGSTTAYTSTSDLYDASKQGTLLGTIICGTSTELTISGNYTFVGLRSASGALYLDKASIVWSSEAATMHTVTFAAGGGSGTMAAGEVEDGTDYTLPGCDFTAPSGKVFDVWSYNDTKYAVGAKIENVTSDITVTALWKDAPTGDLTDVLTTTFFGASGGYAEYGPKVSDNGISYSALMADHSGEIQIRSSSSNSGVIGGNDSYKVKSITIAIASSTEQERTINVYGSTSSYSAPSDLFDSSKCGTSLGTVTNTGGGASTQTINVTGTYSYIGLRSNSNAIYITSITIVWVAK